MGLILCRIELSTDSISCLLKQCSNQSLSVILYDEQILPSFRYSVSDVSLTEFAHDWRQIQLELPQSGIGKESSNIFHRPDPVSDHFGRIFVCL